jgi:hypothetical protein
MSEQAMGVRSGDRTRWAILASITLLGLALRLFRLGAGSIWYDEGVSLYLAHLSIPALIAHTAGDIHPPLYYILLHVWLLLAGESQFAAAFFSLFFGILLIPATYLVARRLLGRDVAVVAAFLVALSPYHLWYSQEMRMYTLGALLGLLSFYFMLLWSSLGGALWSATTGVVAALRRQESSHSTKNSTKRTVALAAYVVCAALGLYTLYYFAFILIFENLAVVALWLAWRRSGRGANIRAWIVAQVAVLVLYMPWLPIALHQAAQPPVPPWRGFTGLWSLFSESWAALSLGQSVQIGAVAFVLLLAGVLYALAFAEKPGRSTTLMLAGYTFVPVLALYLASFVTPLYHVRYVFLYAPAFAIVLARGLLYVRRAGPALPALLLTILTLASLRSIQAYFYDPALLPDDHRSAVEYIAERARPGDVVLIDAGYAYPTFVYYYKGDIAWRGRLVDYAKQPAAAQPGLVVLQTGSINGSSTLGWGSPSSDFYATTEAETAAALDNVARRHERLWLLRIYDTVTDPQGFIRRYLGDRFLMIDDQGFAGSSSMRVQLYRTYRTPLTVAPVPTAAVQANLGNQVRLLGYDPGGTLFPGEAGSLTTYWQSIKPGPDLRAFISLVDDKGEEWAHWDDVPGGPLYSPSRWAANEVVRQVWRLAVPIGTPPGRYLLETGLYVSPNGARLDALDNTGRSTGTVVKLGSVDVGKARVDADIKALPVQQHSSFDLGGEVRLAGYSVASKLVEPGGYVDLSVYWQGIKPATDRIVFLQLQDAQGKLWAAWEGPPAAPWEAGAILRDHYRLLMPADAPDGEMRLVLGIYRADDKQRLLVQGGLPARPRDSIDLGPLRVAGREHSTAIPAMQKNVQARLGDGAELLGYTLSPASRSIQLHLSASLGLTLYWQGLAPMDVPYTVFVQLLGDADRIGGQQDAQPGNGLLPTTSWIKGEVLTDVHQLTVRPDAAPGTYRLVAGLYDATTGARLPVFVNGARQQGDMIVLETVTVR